MKHLIAIAVVVAFLFSGCSEEKSNYPDSTTTVSVATSSETVLQPDPEPEPVNIDLSKYAVENSDNFYDLTLLPEMKGVEVESAALKDENTVILLTGENKDTLKTLDIQTGKLSDLCVIDYDYKGEIYFTYIANTDPVIVYCSSDEDKYYLVSESGDVKDISFILSDSFSTDSYKFIKDNKLYYYDINLSRLMAMDMGTLETETVFSLPPEYLYSSFYGVDTTGEKAVIKADSVFGSVEVTILADIETGEISDVYSGNVSSEFLDKYVMSAQVNLNEDEYDENMPDVTEWYLQISKLGNQWTDNLDLKTVMKDDYIEYGTWIENPYASVQCERIVFMVSNDQKKIPILWDFTKSDAVKLEPDPCIEYIYERADLGKASERATELEEKYGIRVYLGDDAVYAPFPDYSVTAENDIQVINDALDVLEETLSYYPDDYFEQLRGDTVRYICFYITGELIPYDPAISITSPAGLSCLSESLELVAFPAYYINSQTIVHELNHILDHRLIESGTLEDEKWNDVNPEGFEYFNAYVGPDGVEYEFSGDPVYTAWSDDFYNGNLSNIYFVDVYSKTFSTEDRARLMELVVTDTESELSDILNCPHIQTKLEYYFEIIDKYFDRSDWDGEPSWEVNLKRVEKLSEAA